MLAQQGWPMELQYTRSRDLAAVVYVYPRHGSFVRPAVCQIAWLLRGIGAHVRSETVPVERVAVLIDKITLLGKEAWATVCHNDAWQRDVLSEHLALQHRFQLGNNLSLTFASLLPTGT